MNKKQERKLIELLRKVKALSEKQAQLHNEIKNLQHEIESIPSSDRMKDTAQLESKKDQIPSESLPSKPAAQPPVQPEQAQQKAYSQQAKAREKSNLEEFIGGRLITIIGILITVIGISLGAKYAIEKELLSPLVRIILGYIAGIILIGIGIKLRSKYEIFSAALLSGGIAVLYFISFFAYSFYELFPAVVAFVLMLIFTVFTVLAALQYGRQLIAHIGLVGAYAIPFITDTGIDHSIVLLTYMLLINMGILYLAFIKNWQALNYVAFGFTWLIYLTWYFDEYAFEFEFVISFVFAVLFFLQFYIMVLAYKLIKKEKFGLSDIILLLLNTFIFYGVGYHALKEGINAENYLGLYTLGNAAVHCVIAIILHYKKSADKNFLLFTIGLVITFITIAIPVQLSGYWVTLLWTAEAVVLFWIGRAKKTGIYEYLSYPLIFFAFFSLIHDWYSIYPEFKASGDNMEITFVLNTYFLNSLLVAAGFGALALINRNKKYLEGRNGTIYFQNFLNFALPVLVFFVLFYSIRMEIVTYWNKQMTSFSFKGSEINRYIRLFRRLWLQDYYMLYLSFLTILNIRIFKSKTFTYILHALSTYVLLFFIILGLRRIGLLRETYAIEYTRANMGTVSMSMLLGYISYGCVALLLILTQYSLKIHPLKKVYRKFISIITHFVILGVLTGELYHSLDKYVLAENPNIYISMLWGIYALLLIIAGIAHKRKHLRISAIIVFGITLLKLFLFDISNVTTLERFILFISLGILLLVIAFLYTKYKTIILMKDED